QRLAAAGGGFGGGDEAGGTGSDDNYFVGVQSLKFKGLLYPKGYKPKEDKDAAHEDGHPDGGVPGVIEDGAGQLVTSRAVDEADRKDQRNHVPELGGQKRCG